MSNNFSVGAKKYAYLLLAVFCIATITLVVVFSSISTKSTPAKIDEDVPTSSGSITFALPVTELNILKDYSDTALQFNKTLNQWEAHKAISFGATKGSEVFAVYDGVIEDVASSYLYGTTITIDHGNNLKTVYSSLDEDVAVQKGEEVKKGKVIGKVSDTAKAETADGSHLRFEVLKDNQKTNPNEYLMLENK